MAQQQKPRNFLSLASDFERETNLKVKDNMATYIAYCNLRQVEGIRSGLAVVGNFLAEEIRKISPNGQRP